MIGGTTSQNFLLDFGDNTTQQQQRVSTPKASSSSEAPEFGIDLEREYEHIEGLTENFYTKAGKLKQLAASALKAGFDITAPDMTDPMQRQLSNLFMQSYAATQAQANQLYNSNKMLFETSKAQLTDLNLKVYNQGDAPFSMENVGSTEVLGETEKFTSLYAKSYDDPNARKQAQQSLDSYRSDLERRRDLSNDPKEKALMQSNIDYIKNATATYDPTKDKDRWQKEKESKREFMNIEVKSAIEALKNGDQNYFSFAVGKNTGVAKIKPVFHNGKNQLSVTDDKGNHKFVDFDSEGGFRQFLSWISAAHPQQKIDMQSAQDMYDGLMKDYNKVDLEPKRKYNEALSTGLKSMLVDPTKKSDFAKEDLKDGSFISKGGTSSKFNIAPPAFKEFMSEISNVLKTQSDSPDAPLPLTWNGARITGLEFDPEEDYITLDIFRTKEKGGEGILDKEEIEIRRDDPRLIQKLVDENEGLLNDYLLEYIKKTNRQPVMVLEDEKEKNIKLSDPQNIASKYPEKYNQMADYLKDKEGEYQIYIENNSLKYKRIK
jgi:hypothetical protein